MLANIEDRAKRVLALLTAFALVAGLSLIGVLTPAHADEPVAPVAAPVVTVSPSGDLDPSVANVLTVSGTGFVGEGAVNGAYIGFGEESLWAGGGAFPGNWPVQAWVMPNQVVDGVFSTTITIPAGTLDATKTYVVATSAAHGLSATNRSLDTQTTVTVKQPAPVFTPSVTVLKADGVTPLGTSELKEGDEVVVKGSGFDPNGNLAAAGSRPPIAAGKPAGTYVVIGKFADAWKPSTGAASTGRVVGDKRWALSQDAFDAIPANYQGAVSGQLAVVSPEGTFETRLTFKKKTDKGVELEWPETGNFGVYTYAAGGTTNASQELYVPVTVAAPEVPEPVFTPSVTVFKADGVTSLGTSELKEGDQIVVKGTGFDPAANPGTGQPPIAAGSPAGTYVVVGKFADVWKPTAGAASSARVVGDQRWALSQDAFDAIPAKYQGAVSGQLAVVSPEGTFETTLTFKKKVVDGVDVEWPETGNFGVYTYAAGGTQNADQELYVPVTVAAPETPGPVDPVDPVDPALTGELTWGVKASFRNYITSAVAKGTIVVADGAVDNGSTYSFKETAAEYDGTTGAGTYKGSVRFTGHDGQLDLALSNLKVKVTGKTTGVLLADVAGVSLEGGPFSKKAVELATLTLSAPTVADGKTTWKGAKAVLTAAGAEAFSGFYKAGDALDDVTFAVSKTVTDPTDPTPKPTDPTPKPTDPTPKPTDPSPKPTDPVVTPTTPTVAQGQLTWGVKESFRNYIKSPVAKGAIVVGDGAADNGSAFSFTQVATDYDGSTGTTSYAGSVRFTGHNGLLDLSLSNLKVWVTGPTTGVLIADAKGLTLEHGSFALESVELASLTLPAPSVAGGVSTWTGAEAALTADGAKAFSGFYEQGDALDDLTFAVGANAPAPGDGSTDPGTDPGTTPVVPADPAGTYANATASLTTVLPGGEVTITGRGFGSNTAGIEAAIYSDRVLLASGITADAAGVAAATVTIPTTLTPGVHTLSLEGPNGVKSQVSITVEAPVVPPKVCVAQAVSGATLDWGVKAAFRSYITGPIAKGAITTSGVADSGSSFRWTGGSGKFNSEVSQGRVAFGGSVNFTGHGGILDLTLSNVRIQVSSASTASLIADVSSTDMSGTKSSEKNVTVATISLSGNKSSNGKSISWNGAPATLTAAGAKAFAGSYVAGESLDPVSFTFPLGAEVDCDASSGANSALYKAGGLAATGADGTVSTALMALGVMLVGLGAMTVARRRSVRS